MLTPLFFLSLQDFLHPTTTMADKLKGKDAETARKICEGHASMREDHTFSDVVVDVENKEFLCHRAHLAAASDYFKTALTTGMQESRERRITLHDVTEDVFSTLLDCIYGGKYVLTEENLFEIWRAADMLLITVIVAQCRDLCKEIFDTKLSTKNCVDYFCKVRLLDQPAKLCVLEFIYKNFTHCDIQGKAALFMIDEVKSLVAHNTSKILSEDTAIEFVLKWADKNQEPASLNVDPMNNCESVSTTTLESPTSSSGSCLVDVLECTRYLLISRGCLHGTLATHPLVKSDARCQAIVEKIARYHAQLHLQQTWCPPAGIYREHSDMINVLLLCQTDSKGQLITLNLEKMEWGKVAIFEELMCVVEFIYYDSRFYAVSAKKVYIYSLATKIWQVTQCFKKIEDGNGILSVVNESIFVYACTNVNNTILSRDRLVYFPSKGMTDIFHCNSLFSIDTGDTNNMDIKFVTSVGSTEIIFFGREDSKYYTILSTSETTTLYQTIIDKIPSSSRLVTFKHNEGVFVLQENGHLWRIQPGDRAHQIHISFELVLWDEDISLNGAVFYNDQLMIVGAFQDQLEVSEMLDRSLPGIFKSVRKIKVCSTGVNGCPGVTLAVLPKSLLK